MPGVSAIGVGATPTVAGVSVPGVVLPQLSAGVGGFPAQGKSHHLSVVNLIFMTLSPLSTVITSSHKCILC